MNAQQAMMLRAYLIRRQQEAAQAQAQQVQPQPQGHPAVFDVRVRQMRFR
jgi:hypothetical protein